MVDKKKPAAKAAATTKTTTKKSPKASQGAPLAHGVGRRKKSVARVWLRRGSGQIVVNGLPSTEYFDTAVTRDTTLTPFKIVPTGTNYDVSANVVGGGKNGQADAVKLAIARAMVSLDEGIRTTLREHDLLTVDARNKERKKYGQRGARRKFQFVKR
jgi:small subunit ribosomal protein S9